MSATETAQKDGLGSRMFAEVEAKPQGLGAAGVVEVSNDVQAVFGPRAESLKDDITKAL
jgi:phosphotransferase system IIB component